MKKIKRTAMLLLAMLLILCIQLSSVAFAAPAPAVVSDDEPVLKAGTTLLYYVDLTSESTIKSLNFSVLYNSNEVQMISNLSDTLPYINSNYEPPTTFTENGNGLKIETNVRDDATDGMDFKNGERLVELKFKLLRDVLPEINFDFTAAVSFGGSQLVFIGLHEADISWETTMQILPDDGKIPLSSCDITLDQTHFVYDGQPKTPNVTIKHGAHTLVPGEDYLFAYGNNINIGTGYVDILVNGEKYSGFESVEFTIGLTDVAPRNIKDCEIIVKETTFTYNGQPQTLEVTVKDGDKILTDGTDYIIIYSGDNVNVGNVTAFVSGFFNYVGKVSIDFQIIPADESKISISTCNISMDQTFSYTGSPITPNISVTLNGTELKENVDYTKSYENNVNPGTASVTISGIGNYTDTKTVNFTIKEPEVKKVSLNDCTVTLDKSVFTYDGQAKEPVITVKHGATTLSKDTDYTVSYANNVNAGNASVTVTGMGNYIDSVTKNFSIQEPLKSEFTWGTDNWNFNNSSPKYFKKSTYRDQINSTYLSALKANLSNSEYYYVFEASGSWLDAQWGGSCYGMSSTTMLAKEGLFPFAEYQAGATKLTDLASPVNDMEISSLITYYQMLQVKDVIQQQYRVLPGRSHEENIKAILSELDNNTLCLVGFKKAGWGGHAILAYDYEYGSWTFDGVTYDGCIKICDPNSSVAYSKEANIYFNTSSYNWAIPRYSYVPITSASGAVFNYVGSDINHINFGGYLTGSSNHVIDNYVARIDATAISDNRTVSKVVGAEGLYMNQAAAPGEIVEDYSYFMGGESQGTVGYNLFDADASYKVVQDTPVELSLTMDYENCFFTASSKAGTSALFDKNGYVEVNGDASDFEISMTHNSDYPTSWFSVQAEGTGASTVSLKKTEDGYILSSDNLSDVSVKALNKDISTTASFSTSYPSVYIYEVDENTIGVKADADNNGTYETEIDTITEDDTLLGDVNLDGKLNVKDATAVQKHLASIAVLDEKGLSVADFNNDKKVNIKDATAIQKKIAGLI